MRREAYTLIPRSHTIKKRGDEMKVDIIIEGGKVATPGRVVAENGRSIGEPGYGQFVPRIGTKDTEAG